MARHTFGEPLSDDDVLEIQGVDYPMNPLGMRAMRRMLDMQKDLAKRGDTDDLREEDIELAMSIVVESVRADSREALRKHLDDTVGPGLLMQIATAVMRSFSDVDPTQPASSSTGSTPTGPDSAAGAPVAELTPSS